MNNKGINNADSYNLICSRWDEFRRESQVNACIREFANKLVENAKVLDVGCGTGYPIAYYLANRGFQVTGIDVSSNMIERARKLNLTNSSFFVSDLLDFKSLEKYDAIVAFDSIWHIAYSKQRLIYDIFSSLIKPDGYLLFTHGKSDGEVVGEMFGERFYYSALDSEEVRYLLEKNNFEIILFREDYQEASTGRRDLIVVARKCGM